MRNHAASPHKEFYALAELGSVQLVGAFSPRPQVNSENLASHRLQDDLPTASNLR